MGAVPLVRALLHQCRAKGHTRGRAPLVTSMAGKAKPRRTSDGRAVRKSTFGAKPRLVGSLKHILGTSKTDRSTFQFRQHEPSGAVKIEYLFRLCHLVWITTYPINQIVPMAHASCPIVVRPGLNIF